MPDTQVLLVLAVQETGLRSALTAQLALAGASLITTGDVDNPALLRGVRRPAVLVLDGGTAAEQPESWFDSALDDGRWLQVVLLTADSDPEPARSHPKLLCVEAKQAVGALAEKIPHWKVNA